MNHLDRLNVERRRQIDTVVDQLRRLQDDPASFHSTTISWLAGQAADVIRHDNPIDYSPPETAFEGQMVLSKDP